MDNGLFPIVLFMTLSWMFVGTYAEANSTAAPATTTAPPLTFNDTVLTLETNITRAGCGSTQLCVAQPSGCDPSQAGSCVFISARQTSGQNFKFSLSGESDGYLSASVSPDATAGGNDTTYICANNNGKVQFFTALLHNGQLTTLELSANSVEGRVVGNKIQCTFAATIPAQRTRTLSRSMSVFTGTFNTASGALGSPTAVIRTLPVNLANPNATVTNEVTTDTTGPNTTAVATPAATIGPNATAAATPAATTGPNATAAVTPAATTGPNATAAPATTTAPPLTFNGTVLPLETNITRAGCGSTQLCVAQPSGCDPSQAGSCVFISARQTSGQNFKFSLSGESDGYLSASVSPDATAGGNDTTYICANNNGKVQFFTALLHNGQLTTQELSANSVEGRVVGNKIQCTFAATIPAQRTRTLSRSMSVFTGTFNTASGALGSPTAVIRTLPVNLANPNATVTNEVTTDTTGPNTTAVATPAATTGPNATAAATPAATTGPNATAAATPAATTGPNTTAAATPAATTGPNATAAATPAATTGPNATAAATPAATTGPNATAAATPAATTGPNATAAATPAATTGPNTTAAATPAATTGPNATAAATPAATTGPNATAAATPAATTRPDTTAAATPAATTGPNATAAATPAATTGPNATAAATPAATTGPNATAAATPAATTGPNATAAATPAATTGPNTTAAATPAATTGPNATAAATPAATTGPNATAAATPAATTRPDTTAAATPAATTGPNATAAATPAATTRPDTTAAPATTTAATLTHNITVLILEKNISSADCRRTQLCAAEPSDCNPSQAGPCFHLAVRQTSGRNLEFSLSGESTGYLSVSVSFGATAGGSDTCYICANNNGKVQFFTALLNNDQLTTQELPANSVKGRVVGNKIQCTFAATIPAQRTRTLSRSMTVSTGTFNTPSRALGPPTVVIRTPVVNLANPNATITNEVTTNTIGPNTTAECMMTNISRAGCGSMQLCVAQPSDCDPSQAGLCFFNSARQTSGQNFEFSLSGESSGYLSVSLSLDATAGGNDITYICANNNGNVQFITALLDNNMLTRTELDAHFVTGCVDGNKIHCTFNATLPAQSRAQRYSIIVSIGTFITTTGDLGSPIIIRQTLVVNLADPNALTNLVTTNTTTSPSTAVPTTSHAVTLQQSLTHALLVTVGVLGLAML